VSSTLIRASLNNLPNGKYEFSGIVDNALFYFENHNHADIVIETLPEEVVKVTESSYAGGSVL